MSVQTCWRWEMGTFFNIIIERLKGNESVPPQRKTVLISSPHQRLQSCNLDNKCFSPVDVFKGLGMRSIKTWWWALSPGPPPGSSWLAPSSPPWGRGCSPWRAPRVCCKPSPRTTSFPSSGYATKIDARRQPWRVINSKALMLLLSNSFYILIPDFNMI